MKKVTAYKVNRLDKVDLTQYVEGDFFLTAQSIAILANGKLEPLMTKGEVQKMIDKKVKKNG